MKASSPDEFQTEEAALDFMTPFIPKTMKIWECAAGKLNLVNGLLKRGYSVKATDILTGQDFMQSNVSDWDCILTNPPFSIKEKFLSRCFNLGRPFSLILPLTVFDAVDRRALFKDFRPEFIMPPRRIRFETPNHEARLASGKKPGTAWFYSIIVTWKLNIGREITYL